MPNRGSMPRVCQGRKRQRHHSSTPSYSSLGSGIASPASSLRGQQKSIRERKVQGCRNAEMHDPPSTVQGSGMHHCCGGVHDPPWHRSGKGPLEGNCAICLSFRAWDTAGLPSRVSCAESGGHPAGLPYKTSLHPRRSLLVRRLTCYEGSFHFLKFDCRLTAPYMALS